MRAALLRRRNANSTEERVDFLLRLFLQGDVPAATRDNLVQFAGNTQGQSYPVYWTTDDAENHRIRALCHLVLCLPEFQLD